MATGTLGTSARQDPRQVVNTWRKQVNYNDAGISAGVAGLTLPKGAFITQILVDVVVAFNAGTTNVLIMGGNAGMNDIIAAGDVDESSATVQSVTTGLGRGVAAAGDTVTSVKYTQTGTAATAGQAEIVVLFEGNTPG